MSNIVVLTGANRGLGACLSERLAEAGYRVLAVVRKMPPVVPEAWWHAIQTDLYDLPAIEGLASQVKRAAPEGLSALINNAGIAYHSAIADIRRKDVERTFRVNVMAPILLTCRLLDSLRECEGHVVMVTSRLVSGVLPFTASYTAAKRGLDGFAATLRLETGLRVTCVEPGAMETDFLRNTTETRANSHFRSRQLARVHPDQVACHITKLLVEGGSGYVERIQLIPKGQFM